MTTLILQGLVNNAPEVQQQQQQQQLLEPGKLMSAISNLGTGIGTVSACVDLAQKLVYTTSSAVPTGILEGKGWAYLDMKFHSDRNWYKTIEKARNTFVKTLKTLLIDIADSKLLRKLQTIISQVEDDELVQKEGFGIHIHYNNKQAVMKAFYAVFCPSQTTNGQEAYLFGWGELIASGTKATNYMLVSRSKKSLWKEKVWYELVALPPDNCGLTESDCSSIMNIAVYVANLRFQDIVNKSLL